MGHMRKKEREAKAARVEGMLAAGERSAEALCRVGLSLTTVRSIARRVGAEVVTDAQEWASASKSIGAVAPTARCSVWARQEARKTPRVA